MPHYIYILINPALRGLLKIGKTDRSPEVRALELSNGTNMPTPFLVAYEEQVPDGSIAEDMLHKRLGDQGFRVSDKREFFSVPLKTAIKIASEIASELRQGQETTEMLGAGGLVKEQETGSFYFELGLNAMRGTESVLQDYAEARRHFEMASRLGFVRANFFLAQLYLGKSVTKALRFLKSGGEKGDAECYRAMWEIYTGRTIEGREHPANAELSFGWYIEHAKEEIDGNALLDYLDQGYQELGGNVSEWGKTKFSIHSFPGKYRTFCIDLLIVRIRLAFLQIRRSRNSGMSQDEFRAIELEATASQADLILLSLFLSSCVTDGNFILRNALKNVTESDLAYCFAGAPNSEEIVGRYAQHLTLNGQSGARAMRPRRFWRWKTK